MQWLQLPGKSLVEITGASFGLRHGTGPENRTIYPNDVTVTLSNGRQHTILGQGLIQCIESETAEASRVMLGSHLSELILEALFELSTQKKISAHALATKTYMLAKARDEREQAERASRVA